MSSIFKKLAPIAAIAAPFVFPGIGAAIGAGLGVTGAGSATLGSALLGGAGGLLGGGGLKGALGGAALGGLGANLGNFGGAAGLANGAQGAVAPSGILGGLQGATSGTSLGRILSGGLGDGLSSGGSSALGGLNTLSSVFSGLGQESAIKKALAQQNQALTQAQGNVQFNPEDYLNSPAYQFQLEQGQQGLDRAGAARGNFFSGQALKEAAGYNQGLGQQYYNDAFNQQSQQRQSLNDLILQRGNLGAASTMNRANNLSSTLSDILNPVGRYSIYG